ncbi:MAG: MFS transporter [Candidatus Doudnabacteria bacterium]|nr:MFS transporter [Candidatus Doudnabacteria bacterium]
MINKTLRSLFLYNGLFVLAGALLGPLYAVYVQGIKNSPQAISLSWSVFLASSTVFMYVVARYGDRFKKKSNLLIAGFLVRALVWILYSVTTTIIPLLLLQVLFGLGEALGSPAYNAIVAEHLDKSRHMEDYSDQIIFFNITAAIGTALGGFLVYQYGFKFLFYSMAILAIVSAIGVYSKSKKI